MHPIAARAQLSTAHRIVVKIGSSSLTGADGHLTAHTGAEKVVAHFTGLGVPNFTFHRLRHWCGTEMLRGGASLPEVQQFMRHESISSTVLYTQVLKDELVTAATRLPRRPTTPRLGGLRLIAQI
jgi:integrase